MAKKFKEYAANRGIIVNNPSIKTFYSIGIVDRLHESLRRVNSIIMTEIPGIKLNLALYMSLKAMNYLLSPNSLVFTLLVFGLYPKITELDAPSPSITKCAMAMKKTMDEV